MELEVAAQEILDNQQGHRVLTNTSDGETIILRRTKNGIQVLFPSRPRREAIRLDTDRQQSELGIAP